MVGLPKKSAPGLDLSRFESLDKESRGRELRVEVATSNGIVVAVFEITVSRQKSKYGTWLARCEIELKTDWKSLAPTETSPTLIQSVAQVLRPSGRRAAGSGA